MFLKILDLLNLIRFPIFIGIALCAEPLTELFLGEDWSVHYRVLQVLCFVYLFSTIQSFVGQSMVASGKANWGFYNNILQFPLNLLAIYLGSFWGILGIASALLIKSFIILLPRYYFIIKKLYLISLRKYLEVIFKDLILILVPAIFINLFVSYLSLAPLMSLLLMGGAFLIVLFVVYLIFEKEQIKYVKSLI
jgi:O-antigen/teichoic acid export membrane protein